MFKKNYKGIWFYGLAGTGKTLASNFIKKRIKKCLILDGDEIRKNISIDLGYSIKDRKIQIRRILGISKLCIKSKIFPVISTVYMDKFVRKKLYSQGILIINILRDFRKIKNRKHIYNSKMKNVIGKDLFTPRIKSGNTIENNTTKKEFKKKLIELLYE